MTTIAVAIIAMAATGLAYAQTGETPMSLDGARTVSVAEAKALLDKGAAVFDVRKKASYVEGRLPKAKSIKKNDESKAFEPSAFGGNKDAVVVIYGHGSDGWSSVDAVKAAVAGGYKNVHWMRSGWAEWSKAGMPVEH
jgi:rhodanese-related sulfurtransferase